MSLIKNEELFELSDKIGARLTSIQLITDMSYVVSDHADMLHTYSDFQLTIVNDVDARTTNTSSLSYT